jgi:hypothetical protein
MNALLRACASEDSRVALAASHEIAKGLQEELRKRFAARFERKKLTRSQALELPLKKGVFDGDIISDIYEMIPFENGVTPEFPLDLVQQGTEDEFAAYQMPSHGRIPNKNVEGDYIVVQTYPVVSSVDYKLDYARDARWDIVNRAKEALDAGLTRKLNMDGWHTILGAVYDRNVNVFDADAAQGQFTKRLVSLLKTEMRRGAYGNSASTNRGKLTDLYISPEAVEDIRNWGVDQLDEISRREIYVADDGSINRIFMVNLHDLDELGVGQEYQLYYQNTLGGSLQGSDVELVVGLDLQRNDSFVMPVREQWKVFDDPTLLREWKQGWFGRMTVGFAVLNNLRCIAGSF